MIFDRDTGEVREAMLPSGVVGFISWQRLTELLQKHECRENQRITHVQFNERGLTFRVTLAPSEQSDLELAGAGGMR